MSTCALVRKGPYPRLVENCIVAEATEAVEPAYELVDISNQPQICPGWVLTEKGFRPGSGMTAPLRSEIVSQTKKAMTVRHTFQFVGDEQPVHDHEEDHDVRVEKGSFLLTVGKLTSTITPKDKAVTLIAKVPHGYMALEDGSVVVVTIPVPK